MFSDLAGAAAGGGAVPTGGSASSDAAAANAKPPTRAEVTRKSFRRGWMVMDSFLILVLCGLETHVLHRRRVLLSGAPKECSPRIWLRKRYPWLAVPATLLSDGRPARVFSGDSGFKIIYRPTPESKNCLRLLDESGRIPQREGRQGSGAQFSAPAIQEGKIMAFTSFRAAARLGCVPEAGRGRSLNAAYAAESAAVYPNVGPDARNNGIMLLAGVVALVRKW